MENNKEDNVKKYYKIKRECNSIIRDLLFWLIWFGIIIKFFIIDWDVLLMQKYFPNYIWLLKYKVLVFILLIIVSSKMKMKKILLNLLYFISLPAITIFGVIPFWIFSTGKWNGIISYINTIIIFFKQFRYKLVMIVLYVLTLILLINTNNKLVLYFVLLFHIYCIICMIKSIFKITLGDSEIYLAYKKIVNLIANRKESKQQEEYSKIVTIEELKENNEVMLMVESKVLINRILLFAAKKLKDYNNSRTYLFQDIIIFITTSVIGALSLASINYVVFKLNSVAFNIVGDNSTFVDFLLYTISGPNNFIEPANMITKIIEIIKTLIIFVFSGLFISTFLEGSKKKQKNELEDIILYMENTAKEEEKKLIKKDLFEDINSVITSLEEIKSSLVGIIIKITEKLQ